jgi:hypothetical protein
MWFVVPRADRRWGILFIGYGVLIGFMSLVLALLGMFKAFPAGVAVGLIGSWLLGTVFVVVGYLLALRLDRLKFDLDSKQYHYQYGYPIRVRRKDGSINDFERLSLVREIEEQPDSGRTINWQIELAWKDRNRTPILLLEIESGFSTLFSDRRQTALEVMKQLRN